ncbi:MAG TPA: tRNA lysidine(34) synthetase TilS [Nitrospiria bacterium]|nr:tRNA lysidine(34) synthetase TilS [Nitrospiria bacterium]
MTIGVPLRRDARRSIGERLRLSLSRLGPVARGDTLVVGVSGGPDSLTLLHGLRALSREMGFAVHAAHFDHGLRGEQSAAEARVVAEIADRWDVPCTIERAANGRIEARGRGLQAAARSARYDFLGRVAEAVGAQWIATAHTADDQAETVLMRWLRGAGPAALAGIPAIRGRVIRPLLGVDRRDIEAYVVEQGLTPLRDPSNEDPRFLRVRVRQDVMPTLRALNPRAVHVIARSAGLLADDAAWLDEQARTAFEHGRVGEGPGWIELHTARFRALPLVIQRRVIRLALSELAVCVDRVSAERIDAAARASVDRTSGCLALGQGAAAEYAAAGLRLTRGPARISPPEGIALPDGECRPPGWDLAVRVTRVAAFAAAGAMGPWQAAFDTGRLPGMLGLRSWRAGDRLDPEGMTGRKRVQDLFVDEKIPRWRRTTAPLVTAGDQVVWVVGFRRDRRYAARPGAPATIVDVVRTPLAEPGADKEATTDARSLYTPNEEGP